MDNTLDDDSLTQKHKELLEAQELQKFDFSQEVPDEDIKEIIEGAGGNLIKIEVIDTADPKFRRKCAYFSVIHAKAVKDALDMAYKLKGKYAPEKSVNVNIEVEADERVYEAAKLLNGIFKGGNITSDGAVSGSMGA